MSGSLKLNILFFFLLFIYSYTLFVFFFPWVVTGILILTPSERQSDLATLIFHVLYFVLSVKTIERGRGRERVTNYIYYRRVLIISAFFFFFRVYGRLFLIPTSLKRHSGLLTLFSFMNCCLSTCVYHVRWYLCFGRLFITVSPSESQPGLVTLPLSHVSAYIFIISGFLRVSFVFREGVR